MEILLISALMVSFGNITVTRSIQSESTYKKTNKLHIFYWIGVKCTKNMFIIFRSIQSQFVLNDKDHRENRNVNYLNCGCFKKEKWRLGVKWLINDKNLTTLIHIYSPKLFNACLDLADTDKYWLVYLQISIDPWTNNNNIMVW